MVAGGLGAAPRRGPYGGGPSACAAVCCGRRELAAAPPCLWVPVSCGSRLSAPRCSQGPWTAQPHPRVGLSRGPAVASGEGRVSPEGGRPLACFPGTATPSGLCFLRRSSRLLVSDAVFPLSSTAVHAFVFLSVASDFGGFGGRETIAARSVRCLDGKAQGCLLPSAPGAGPASVRACRARPAVASRLPALPCTSSGLPSRPAPTLPQCSPGASGPAPVPLPVPLSPLQCGQLCPDEKMACWFDECGFPPS